MTITRLSLRQLYSVNQYASTPACMQMLIDCHLGVPIQVGPQISSDWQPKAQTPSVRVLSFTGLAPNARGNPARGSKRSAISFRLVGSCHSIVVIWSTLANAVPLLVLIMVYAPRTNMFNILFVRRYNPLWEWYENDTLFNSRHAQ